MTEAPFNVLYIILTIIVIEFLIEHFLEFLNLKNISSKLPLEADGIYDEAKYAKSQNYLKINTQFSWISSTFSLILTLIVFKTGILGVAFDSIYANYNNIYFSTLIFLAFFGIASDLISIPFECYGTFVIEEKFGFNKTTIKTYFFDKIKGYLLGGILGGFLICALLWTIQSMGTNFWIYFWIILSCFILLLNMFYASIILPLFNKLTPLEDGELKTAIVNYAKKVEFPLAQIYVMDGSKRSGKANAFFSGMGKYKKIVLYDTLIKNHTLEELVAVLAHEVGHFKKKHIWLTLALTLLQVGAMLYIFSFVINSTILSEALGAKKLSIPLNLMAFGVLYTPISKITALLMNIISRKNEFEADEFAKNTYHGEYLISGLKKLSSDNLSNLNPHPWYSFYNYSHPPVLERIKALKPS